MSVFTVDFGHTTSGGDTGARGNGFIEELKTREIGNLVVSGLRSLGHTVHIIELAYASTMAESLNYRVNRIIEINPDQSVSIHINSSVNITATGVEVWGDNLCKDMCNRICANIANEFNIPNRGFKNGVESLALVGLYGQSNIPALLVECFFLCNANDCNKYDAQKYADCIIAGILNKEVNIEEPKVKGTGFSNQGELKVDSSIRLAATAEQLADAQYKFWVCDRSSNTWSVLQNYALKGNIITWIPKKAGNHTLVVHVKHKASTREYDDAMSIDVNIKEHPSVKCTGFSLAGIKEVNEKLVLSATSEPTEESMYKFWVCDRSSNTWVVLQDYVLKKNILDYIPKKEGNYTFVVHCKHKASVREYDDVKAIDLVIKAKAEESKCNHVEEVKKLEDIKKEIDIIINNIK